MRFIEIDGKRHDVPCCYSCPCYDNGDDGWGCRCKHPDGDGVSAEHGGGWWRGEENFGPNCPLREKPELAEGGVVDPCGIEMFFLSPLDSEKEIVIPEHIMEVLGSLKVENEKPRRTMVMDDEQRVAMIECEVMEKALTYICNLFEELEQAIEHSEPIKQGIYLERLRNAILSQREEMVRRQVDCGGA